MSNIEKVIAYDLGTGGIKASIFDANGSSLASSFIQYDTHFPKDKYHEQRPLDWWAGVCESTRKLLASGGFSAGEISGVALSGHSLVAVPIGKKGELLCEYVPIWSDTRASDYVQALFQKVPYEKWYMTTGNGFPPECYTLFKLMWMKDCQPELFSDADRFLGSKDYINYMLTGEMYTDYSYASGTGVYDLLNWRYSDMLMDASGIDPRRLAPIIASDDRVGYVTAKAAELTGLREGTPVFCGGVDNSCMQLGAKGNVEGRAYTSLGSSSWIATSSRTPVLSLQSSPYVFAHIIKGMYTSALSIFSGGNSFRWVRDAISRQDDYDELNKLAAQTPVGANGVMFNPSLAGGTAMDKSINIRGAFMGISLGTTYADLVRASMEGVALNLRVALDELKKETVISDEMLFCGGGSKSPVFRKIFADVFHMPIVKTNIDQEAASLGAAAIALKGCGVWKDYEPINDAHKLESIERPDAQNAEKYEALLDVFKYSAEALSDIGDRLYRVKQKWNL